MKKTLCQKTIIVVLLTFTLMLWLTNARALVVGTGPFDVVLIGKFICPDEKGTSRTFELWSGEKKWRFTVTKPYVLNADMSGSRLLSEIFPRKIQLFGEEKVLKPLMQPEMVGKIFKLKGNLYINAKRLHLSFVEEIIEEKQD